MFFKKIEIHNFRSIESLIIDNIKQVNLITGKNNCGKTSILEAIFLLVGMSNPQLAYNIHSFRDLALTDDEDFSYIFKNFDFSNNPSIKGQLDSQERFLTIKPIYPTFTQTLQKISEKRELSKEELVSNTSTGTENAIEGLELVFGVDDQENLSTEIKLRQSEIKLSGDYKEKISCSFINSNTIMDNLDRKLEAILVRKDLNTIINSLRKIEPNLLDIRLGARGMVYVDIGIDKLVPIKIRRILGILAAIPERKNGVLLIDEIENGLHYSTLSVLWKAILKSAVDNNVQLFITTHSYECIQAITEVYEDKTSYMDRISLFRIERNAKDQHKSFQYEADVLLAGIEKEFEVR